MAEFGNKLIDRASAEAESRLDFWINFINETCSKRFLEVGVYKGEFAAEILKGCEQIEAYYMLDPWRHLDGWNKPANKPDDVFEAFFAEAKRVTKFASQKRIILRGRTTEVIDEIPDEHLDLAYIDGDHTLRGISIDLLRVYSKVRTGGWVGGDDFTRTIWQHRMNFEPTLVFPYAVYFAEAMNVPIYALPFRQFLIEKNGRQGFSFIDPFRQYRDLGLRAQLKTGDLIERQLSETYPFARTWIKRVRRWFSK